MKDASLIESDVKFADEGKPLQVANQANFFSEIWNILFDCVFISIPTGDAVVVDESLFEELDGLDIEDDDDPDYRPGDDLSD